MHLALVFILGIIIGSFLNVCIYRIPRKESIAYPASHCIYCNSYLKWYDLVPMLSYLSLKGKCRYCGGSISPRYPFVELLTGIIYLLTFYHYGLSLNFIFYSFLLSILIAISFIDYDEQIIPDGLLLILLSGATIYKLLNYFLLKLPLKLWDNIFGFLIGFTLFFLIALISKGSMGGGDIKLIALLGLILGLKKTLLNILLSFIIGAIVSIVLLLTKRKGRKDAIPFGPFINIGFLITLFWGDLIINWYIRTLLRYI